MEELDEKLKIPKEKVNASIEKIWNQRSINLGDSLNSIYASIEKEDPSYYNFRFNNKVVSVKQVQDRLLDSNTSLVEYFWSDSLLITYVIKKDTFFITKRTPPHDLKSKITSFLSDLSRNNRDKLLSPAKYLYDILLKDIEGSLTKDVIIVPDGMLSLLPFEALRKSGNPIDHWAIEDHSFSYAHSATMLDIMKSKETPQNQEFDFVGFAPVYSKLSRNPATRDWDIAPFPNNIKENLQPNPTNVSVFANRGAFDSLKYNQPELLSIKYMFRPEKSKTFIGKEARRVEFFQFAQKCRIFHLPVHAKAYEEEGDYSFIALSYYPGDSINDVRLFAKEIYGLSIQADMVVLSGCQTGLGRLNNGEGVIGLGRAFASAGAKSLVLSLWSVDDESTKDLMVSFYKHLMEGKPKNEALREAKLELINAGKSPVFWAPFVQYGDTSSIFLKR